VETTVGVTARLTEVVLSFGMMAFATNALQGVCPQEMSSANIQGRTRKQKAIAFFFEESLRNVEDATSVRRT
jgi:hypothetical protein